MLSQAFSPSSPRKKLALVAHDSGSICWWLGHLREILLLRVFFSLR